MNEVNELVLKAKEILIKAEAIAKQKETNSSKRMRLMSISDKDYFDKGSEDRHNHYVWYQLQKVVKIMKEIT